MMKGRTFAAPYGMVFLSQVEANIWTHLCVREWARHAAAGNAIKNVGAVKAFDLVYDGCDNGSM